MYRVAHARWDVGARRLVGQRLATMNGVVVRRGRAMIAIGDKGRRRPYGHWQRCAVGLNDRHVRLSLHGDARQRPTAATDGLLGGRTA